MRTNRIWITWENQIRNRGISKALGFPLHELVYDAKPRLVRYICCISKTISLIYTQKPEIVAVQNPSIVLAVLGMVLSKVFGFKLIVDAHNSGIFPAEGKVPLLMTLSGFIQRHSALTLVTNQALAEWVNANLGKAFVLPDRIPEVPFQTSLDLEHGKTIACICTFSEDEPYLEILHAASKLPEDILIYFTGNFRGKVDPEKVPSNVRLLGFVSDEDYWGLLHAADIVMDLTLRENCLVCGAYEAIAALKPVVLSETKALMAYFSKGCVYVACDYKSIARGILYGFENFDRLSDEIRDFRTDIEIKWDAMRALLAKEIEGL